MVATHTRPEDPREPKESKRNIEAYNKYSKVVDATFALVLIGVILLMGIFITFIYYTATCKCQ